MSNCYAGKDGVVKVEGDAIGGLVDWTIDYTVDTIECSQMGTTYRTYVPSLESWSGSFNVRWSPDAGANQANIAPGAILSLVLFPEGETAGDVTYTGDIIVTGLSRTASFDGLIEMSVSFDGTGALTTGAVA
jgi:hypothetical protein